jgi:hypothetical protein
MAVVIFGLVELFKKCRHETALLIIGNLPP